MQLRKIVTCSLCLCLLGCQSNTKTYEMIKPKNNEKLLIDENNCSLVHYDINTNTAGQEEILHKNDGFYLSKEADSLVSLGNNKTNQYTLYKKGKTLKKIKSFKKGEGVFPLSHYGEYLLVCRKIYNKDGGCQSSSLYGYDENGKVQKNYHINKDIFDGAEYQKHLYYTVYDENHDYYSLYKDNVKIKECQGGDLYVINGKLYCENKNIEPVFGEKDVTFPLADSTYVVGNYVLQYASDKGFVELHVYDSKGKTVDTISNPVSFEKEGHTLTIYCNGGIKTYECH